MYNYWKTIHCSKSYVHVFEEYVYLDFFSIQIALATPELEPARSRYRYS